MAQFDWAECAKLWIFVPEKNGVNKKDEAVAAENRWYEEGENYQYGKVNPSKLIHRFFYFLV